MYDLLVKNGVLVSHDKIFKSDIVIHNGKYAAFIDEDTEVHVKRIIDAQGAFIFPGIIDCHAHFNEPGYTWREDFETGTRAAAVGGTTTVFDMPLNNDPPMINEEVFQIKKNIIKSKALIDYGLWAGLVDNNLDHLIGLNNSGVIGFKGFTSPMGDNPFTNVKPNQIKEALLLLKPYHAICAFHCEDYDMIRDMTEKALNEHKTTVKDFLDVHNVLAEYTATKKIIELSKETDSRVHICHVSHPMVAQLIKEAIMDNLKVTAETCPHYLCASQDLIYKLGAVAKCTPPLRTAKASEELWNYVIDGTLSCIGSDHSPATESEKDNSVNTIWTAWGGLNSIQYFLPIMFNAIYHHRKLSPQLITQTMSYNPAKIFGVHHKKGSFIVGHDGDLVILDPNKVWKIKNDTLFTKNKITAFNGFSGKGLPIYTIVRGEIIAENGMYKDKFGFGKIIKPQNNSPTL